MCNLNSLKSKCQADRHGGSHQYLRAGVVAQMVECLLSKYKVQNISLSSTCPSKKINKKQKSRQKLRMQGAYLSTNPLMKK
jgi:hypothetical protein